MEKTTRHLGSFLPAIASALILAMIGALSMAARMSWLFPSLGPTVAIQTTSPDAPAAQPWNVPYVVGPYWRHP
jgi:hypothetical protein